MNTRMSSITLRFHKASIKKNFEDWFFIQLTTFTAPYKQTNYSLFLFLRKNQDLSVLITMMKKIHLVAIVL